MKHIPLEKVALALAIATMAAGLVAASGSSARSEAAETAAATQELLAAMRRPHGPIEEVLRPRHTEGPIETGMAMPEWIASYATRVRVVPDEKKPKVSALRTPVLEIKEAVWNGVALAWSFRGDGVLPDSIEISRRESRGDWCRIAQDVDPRAGNYRDETVSPEGEYEYRAVATSHRQGMSACTTNTVRATVPSRFDIRFEGVTRVRDRLYVLVRISRRDTGDKLPHPYGVGEVIGAREGPQAVDFNTGWTIRDIREAQVVRDVLRCRTRRAPGGPPIACVTVKDTEAFATHLIEYVDDAKRTQRVLLKQPTLRDDRCPQHRGQP